LTNASKHSAATEVAVELEAAPGGCTRLVVTDNGRGFDAAVSRPGLGLLGMRERSEALGGTFRLGAKLGEGVRLTIELPAQGQRVS
jgi:signal transduction histidine kinase